MKTLLDDAGRIQLPVSVQTQMGIKPGDELTLEEVNGKWLIKPFHLPADELPVIDAVEDLDWEDLDYFTVPPNQSRKLAVRIKHRGRLEPISEPFTVCRLPT